MDISMMDEYVVPVIVIGALCIGYVLKNWMPTDDRWIPTILMLFGAVSGIILAGWSYDSFVKGMLSGLAAVGLNQVFKQHMKLPMDADELFNMGRGEEEDE